MLHKNRCGIQSLVYINAMSTEPEKKRPGRKPLPLDQKRSDRIAMRTYPDVAEKARRVGTEAVEAAIRKIKEAK